MNDWGEPAGSGALGDGGEESLSGSDLDGGNGERGALDDHLWILAGETVWDLGPAQLDADADGVPDSLTRGADGQITVYTDTDSDGRVDRITEMDPTGRCSVSDLDPDTGLWQASVLGRLE
ncbi:DUF6802 family protein [Gordonia caeni]|uniref:DUF6802 domain-containing protein n=1 Tax=Gordonia caeni TaxID=1007097 RepID=A0ABP7NMC0_9ACTN